MEVIEKAMTISIILFCVGVGIAIGYFIAQF